MKKKAMPKPKKKMKKGCDMKAPMHDKKEMHKEMMKHAR